MSDQIIETLKCIFSIQDFGNRLYGNISKTIIQIVLFKFKGEVFFLSIRHCLTNKKDTFELNEFLLKIVIV